MVKTLDELKAQNAAEEAAALEAAQKAQTDENEMETGETEGATQVPDGETEEISADEEGDIEGAESKTDPGEEPDADAEDWMNGDHTPDAEKKFTDGDIGKAKARLKAKLADSNGELEKANARIAELEAAPQGMETELTRPSRDDFFEKDDPDAAYDAAYEEYLLKKIRAESQASNHAANLESEQAAQLEKVSRGEDAHYERAAKLVTDAGISPESYQAADSAFRTAIDHAAPGYGDDLAAALISRLGEGSEKVVYSVGISSDKARKFSELLKSDPSGLNAYGYLIELKTMIANPRKKQSAAPKPAPQMNGDAVDNSKTKAIKNRYSKSSDMQERIDIRAEARGAGVSAKEINTW